MKIIPFATFFALALAQGGFAQVVTLPNPAPAAGDNFGSWVAAVGEDRLLVAASGDDTSATDAGIAYLFSTNGTLVTTFTNPTPAVGDTFGIWVAPMGKDRVLVGAHLDDTGATDAGAAYLFNTNGTLLTTFTNPAPRVNGHFGFSVVAVGSDRVLIGAPNNGATVTCGAAYLFNTNGTLLNTFTNPTPFPSNGEDFGFTVAAMGGDKVLVGDPFSRPNVDFEGAAYLFNTNGTLLTTFTNLNPFGADLFGLSLVAVGNDRVLVGAPGKSSAYLYNTNGALLLTFPSPAGTGSDFGSWVETIGSDRVVISAHEYSFGASGGRVCLFNTNGTLLNTITNPTPAVRDMFGTSFAIVGNEKLLVGALNDDTDGTDAGSAYLINLPSVVLPTPVLKMVPLTPGSVTISWSPNNPGWILQEATYRPPLNWTNSPSSSTNPITVPAAASAKFYRLFKP